MINLKKILDSRIGQFLYPKITEGDVVSVIFAKSFRWSFTLVFILAIFIFMITGREGFLYQYWTEAIRRTLAFVTFREYKAVDDPRDYGHFLLISFLSAFIFYHLNEKKIPTNAWDLGWFGTLLILFYCISIMVLVVISSRVCDALKITNGFEMGSLFLIVFVSYIYGIISLFSARILMLISVAYGWRRTDTSPYYKKKSDHLDKGEKNE